MRDKLRKLTETEKNIAAALIAGVFLLTPLLAVARVFYYGTAGLATGDITTSHILDATILDIDISSSTQIMGSKLRQSGIQFASLGERYINNATGTLAMRLGGMMVTSVVSGGIPFFDSNTSVSGTNALTANAVMLGGGAGAGPSTVSGLGTSGQVLTSNGAGTAPTFQTAGGFTNIGDRWVAANASSVKVTLSANNLTLFVRLVWPATTTNGDRRPAFWFNEDDGANYNWRISKNNGVAITGSSQSSCAMWNAAITSPAKCQLEISNTATTVKMIAGHCLDAIGAASIPNAYDFSCTWTDTTNPITRIQVDASDDLVATGARVTVYGIN